MQHWFPGFCAPTVPLRDPSKPVVLGPGTRFLLLRRPHFMASPAKADPVLASCPASDTLAVGPAADPVPGLGVQIPTGPVVADSSVTPPSSCAGAPEVLQQATDDAEDPEEESTWGPLNDIEVMEKWMAEPKAVQIPINKLHWDYDMKYGQIRKLSADQWKEIMGTFGKSPPFQPGNVVVRLKSGMATPVARL